MDFFIPIISVIGFGETGSLIASFINESKGNVDINIMDPSQDIEGKFLDLKHASIPQNNKVHHNNIDLLRKSQLIFHTAGVRGQVGENRNNKALDSLNIINDVFQNTSFKESALVLNISNPVEATAQWIHEATNRQLNVISTGTLLDTYRLKCILSDEFEIPYSLIETVVAGEHGSNMFPIWSQTKIRGKKISTLVSEEKLDEITDILKSTAKKIRETEQATKYGVAQTALVLANQYFSQEEAILPFTFNANNFLGEDLFINWPCRISRQHIIPSKIKLNEKETDSWKTAIKSIKKTTALKTSNNT